MAGRRAPGHLQESSGALWRRVVVDYDLEAHHERLLTLACEALDRAEQARESIASEGAYHRNRHGDLRPHPGLAVERDARVAYARLMRELDLEGEPSPGVRR